jgi:hypothetical protein
MKSDRIKQLMSNNAAVLRQLQRRIHETFEKRHHGPVQLKAWMDACREAHERYDELAMPGGYGAVLEGLERGDPGAIDIALCFVELRPYFFRSGYMYTLLMRRLKKCAKTQEQAYCHARVVERAAAWREQRKRSSLQ